MIGGHEKRRPTYTLWGGSPGSVAGLTSAPKNVRFVPIAASHRPHDTKEAEHENHGLSVDSGSRLRRHNFSNSCGSTATNADP
jgi:hypothetical protein